MSAEEEEFYYFDVVIHSTHVIDTRFAYVTTWNTITLAANQ